MFKHKIYEVIDGADKRLTFKSRYFLVILKMIGVEIENITKEKTSLISLSERIQFEIGILVFYFFARIS